MEIEQIKQLAIDVNNVAAAAFKSGQEHNHKNEKGRQKMTIHEVVRKLIGPIEPAGDSSCDGKRFENLKAMTKLVGLLIGDIGWVGRSSISHEYSVKRAGEFANKYLTDLKSE